MTTEDLYNLRAYLELARNIARQYQESDEVWNHIEQAIDELDLIVLPEEAA